MFEKRCFLIFAQSFIAPGPTPSHRRRSPFWLRHLTQRRLGGKSGRTLEDSQSIKMSGSTRRELKYCNDDPGNGHNDAFGHCISPFSCVHFPAHEALMVSFASSNYYLMLRSVVLSGAKNLYNYLRDPSLCSGNHG